MRVLLIEDDRTAADALAKLLGMCGHEVDLAYTGIAGVMAAKRRLPDVVLSDIDLPGFGSRQAAASTPGYRTRSAHCDHRVLRSRRKAASQRSWI